MSPALQLPATSPFHFYGNSCFTVAFLREATRLRRMGGLRRGMFASFSGKRTSYVGARVVRIVTRRAKASPHIRERVVKGRKNINVDEFVLGVYTEHRDISCLKEAARP